MKTTRYSFLYLMLSASIAMAGIDCPDPELVRNMLRDAGRERISNYFLNKIKRIEDQPELYLRLQMPFINSEGDMICPYYHADSSPLIAINIGPAKVKKPEKLAPPPMEKMEKMEKTKRK